MCFVNYNTGSLNMRKRSHFCSTWYEHTYCMMLAKNNTRSNYANSGSFKYNYILSLTTSESSLWLHSDLKLLDSLHLPVFLTHQLLLADQYSQFSNCISIPKISNKTLENPSSLYIDGLQCCLSTEYRWKGDARK